MTSPAVAYCQGADPSHNSREPRWNSSSDYGDGSQGWRNSKQN